MTGKEKLQLALNHKEGQVPVDFGATSVTRIHCSVVEKLRKIYGLKERPIKVHEPYQMLGYIDEDLLNAMDIDIVGIFGVDTMFGFPLGSVYKESDFKEWKTPWGQKVLVPNSFEVSEDANYFYLYPAGDRSAPPSGQMPKSGFFFDTIVRQEPLDDENLNVEDNLEEFGGVSEADLDFYRESVKSAQATGKGIIASFGGTAFGDIALVPAPNLRYPKGIRDITEWYISTVTRQDYIHEIFKEQTRIAIENLKKIHGAVGNSVDALFICGTDFGTQTGQFCSPETFNTLYAPYYKEVNDWIHANTTWKTFKHSCGAVEPFISSMIEAGFDILNPVQCSATGMDPNHLKETYGAKLTFWGGGVDTQKTLPFGTPEEVRTEVRERLEIFSKNGGYVFNTIHNLQAATPIENVEAMLETVVEFNNNR
ncbi:MAG: uroporphyrinogen decarboxylase family protein [Sphaerochaetaceae bacterium]